MPISNQIRTKVIGEELQGVQNSSNVAFLTLNKFVQSDDYDKIEFMRNGQEQLLGFDYIVEESVVGEGYDTVICRKPPRKFESLKCNYLLFKEG